MKIEDFRETQKLWAESARVQIEEVKRRAAEQIAKIEKNLEIAKLLEEDLIRLDEIVGSGSPLFQIKRDLRIAVFQAPDSEEFKKELQGLGVYLIKTLHEVSFEPVIGKELKEITVKIVHALMREPAHGNQAH